MERNSDRRVPPATIVNRTREERDNDPGMTRTKAKATRTSTTE